MNYALKSVNFTDKAFHVSNVLLSLSIKYSSSSMGGHFSSVPRLSKRDFTVFIVLIINDYRRYTFVVIN